MVQLVSTPAAAFLVLVAICLIHTTSCKLFTTCGLYDELVRLKFSRTFIPHWVCLVDAESGKDTSKIGGVPGRERYGLFQISSRTFCRKGSPGGLCNAKCEDFLNDDITDDARCAVRIFNTHGFKAWPGWVRACYGRNEAVAYAVRHCVGRFRRINTFPASRPFKF